MAFKTITTSDDTFHKSTEEPQSQPHLHHMQHTTGKKLHSYFLGWRVGKHQTGSKVWQVHCVTPMETDECQQSRTYVCASLRTHAVLAVILSHNIASFRWRKSRNTGCVQYVTQSLQLNQNAEAGFTFSAYRINIWWTRLKIWIELYKISSK